MIIGVLSDAHGNFIGLKQCLDFLKNKAERIFFLGDAVGDIPFPNEVIDQLRQSAVECILGNHDAMLLGILPYSSEKEEIFKIRESKNNISDIKLEVLKTLPQMIDVVIDGKRILFVHGNPVEIMNGYVYPDSDLSPFSKSEHDVVFMGHTLRSFVRSFKGKKFINAGSCGFSRDTGNQVSAVLFD